MDLALNNYLVMTSQDNTLYQEKRLNINNLILDEFIATLDATPTTKETYIKGINIFIRWCEDNEVSEFKYVFYKDWRRGLRD